MESTEVARRAVEAASDKQADNIVMLDTREVCSIADYFVICSGESSRQIEAIWQEIREKLKRDGVVPSHIEGAADSGWILLDLLTERHDPPPNDSGHKLRALTFQLQETPSQLHSLNALISTAPAAHASFMPLLDGNPDFVDAFALLPGRW